MNQNERPVPPEGAQSAPPVTPPVTNQAAPKNKQPKSTGSGGGVKSFLYGLLGGVVSIALVACDMVFPSRNLISAELEALMEEETDVAVPKTKHGYEPFHAVYRRSSCLPVVREATEAGESRATGWFDKVNITEFDGDRVAQAEPRGGCFINVNTPEELSDAQERILAGKIAEREEFE